MAAWPTFFSLSILGLDILQILKCPLSLQCHANAKSIPTSQSHFPLFLWGFLLCNKPLCTCENIYHDNTPHDAVYQATLTKNRDLNNNAYNHRVYVNITNTTCVFQGF